ncbi:tissue factor pathway inhibitor a isoform X2 [Hypomesus transpacificus]|uniref:tissue factor pathway inhibitor a isoform X2 n=1 Tax=Hypomesus transpacificus TaxID=137520 RepID=UPI001F087E60|nr:tissue factor pathway inhibitor a isoform X2 [Hypomesus transpacificus]
MALDRRHSMAFKDQLWIVCIVFISCVDLITCQRDSSKAEGSQPELFIFSEVCAFKKDEGPCKARKDRFYFDIDIGRSDKSPCHLEEAPGPCRGLVTRFLFDSQSQECRQFFYGGCFGNANNFRSLKECQARCQDPGNTSDATKVHDPTSKPGVQPLRVTGESSLSEAQTLPSSHQVLDFSPPDVCLPYVDRGSCDGLQKRFFYNPKTSRCHMFRYSGCGGNKNNFVLKRHCVRTCMNMKGVKESTRTIRIRKKNSNLLFRSV